MRPTDDRTDALERIRIDVSRDRKTLACVARDIAEPTGAR
jgi:hypothetical protein